MPLSLVILAAGKGTRFGGDKPLAAVGPGGQSLFEFSVFDAVEAGFEHVVFVVHANQDTIEISSRLQHYGEQIKIEFVIQDLEYCASNVHTEQISLTRTKPWGTAHAVLVCRERINNPFVVINADDYHGRSNFSEIGKYLLENQHNPQLNALPGYELKNTLSKSGGVNRGICGVDTDGYLESIHEVRNICVHQNEANLNSIVSMTFWGFSPSVFSIIENKFKEFLIESSDLVNEEFYIPNVVDHAIKSGELRVKVFQTSEKWKGLTYAGDIVEVKNYIASLIDAGWYPKFRDA